MAFNPNHDPFSACMLDHAPPRSEPNARELYQELREALARKHGEGDAVDVTALDDDVIESVRDQCAYLRTLRE